MSDPSDHTGAVGPLATLPVSAFLDMLAGPSATPGGGSAAALAGALAASLVAMVGGLSAGNQAISEEARPALAEMEREGRRLIAALATAIDRDAEAYNSVMAAFRQPKATEAQKAERSAAIQAAMKQAAQVPLEVAEQCEAAAKLALQALEQGNPNASSDAGVALLLAVCGLEGAALNVATNLDAIKEKAFVADKQAQVERLLTQAGTLKAQMWAAMRTRIRSLPA